MSSNFFLRRLFDFSCYFIRVRKPVQSDARDESYVNGNGREFGILKTFNNSQVPSILKSMAVDEDQNLVIIS